LLASAPAPKTLLKRRSIGILRKKCGLAHVSTLPTPSLLFFLNFSFEQITASGVPLSPPHLGNHHGAASQHNINTK
jgi:hypothetical protein